MRTTKPLLCTIAACLALSGPAPAAGTDDAITKTYTYKRVGDLEIKLNVIRADDDKIRPVVVWIHGGALIMGGREGVSQRVRKMFLDAGYAVVSLDYRLAPETRLPRIIEDIEDAFKWLRREGPDLFHVDTDKIAVMGGSAGGYLTLATGHRVEPRATVLVAFWGYGDLIGDWYSKPSPHPRHTRTKITEAEARKLVAGPPIANAKNRKAGAGAFYQFCRQRGIWPQEVSGWDPRSEAEKYTPYMPVKNVDKQYPPTLLIHGMQDTDVPHEQSIMMAEQFKKHGVDHEFISIAGGEHGLGGGDPKKIDQAYQRAFQFVHRRMASQ